MKQKFDHATYHVFGAVVHQKRVAAGDTYKAVVTEDTDSERFGNIAVFTKGRITGVREDGTPLPFERVPGVHSLGRSHIPAGNFTFTAQEDSEWWCINVFINRYTPNIRDTKVLSLQANESRVLDVGTKLLIVGGELSIEGHTLLAGDAVEVETGSKNSVALTNCYGFLFA